MNLALELFLTAFGTIMGIVVLFTLISKIIAKKEEAK
ncbi:hypothetical protein VIRA109638_03400 [Vibrio rarus]